MGTAVEPPLRWFNELFAPRSGHLYGRFLQIRRATTRPVCAELGLKPWQDPHNADRRFARVCVRNTACRTALP